MASPSLLPSAVSSPHPAAVRSTRCGHVSASSVSPPSTDECGPRSGRSSLAVSKREALASVAVSLVALSTPVPWALSAILEADDDEELLEKVKKDRKKRIERQGVINSSKKETGYLQDAIYKLSKVGQAIEKDDLPSAGSVLGPSTDAEWIKNVNSAFSKLTSSPEGQTEVDTFNSSLLKLISSVGDNDVESSKVAFVSSAGALEKWVGLSGLLGQLKGL